MMPYKTVFSIAAVMALRMLGLFMIMPLLALYAINLPDVTPFLLGVAVGIYGLTQACFQMPLGIISDFKGRKTIIVLGLSLFTLGSVIAASTHSIFMLIVGRAIQGLGAVGSTLMALLSDLVQEACRARAMAILGGIIGISFSLSLILGPLLNAWLTVPGIFWLCAAMGIAAILLLSCAIPDLKANSLEKFSFFSVFSRLKKQLSTQKKIMRLNTSSLFLHMILVMTFISIPVALKNYGHMPQNQQWKIYLPVLLLSFVVVLTWIMLSEKKKNGHVSEPVQNLARLNKNQRFFAKLVEILNRFSITISIGLIMLSQFGLIFFHYNLVQISTELVLFFTGFNFLEATLPAELSKQVEPTERGMAMGLYSTMQFTGIFLGGLLGGLVYGYFSITGIFIFSTMVATGWLISHCRALIII